MFISKKELKDIQNRLGLLENLVPELIFENEELCDELDELEDEYLEVLFPEKICKNKINKKTCKTSKSVRTSKPKAGTK